LEKGVDVMLKAGEANCGIELLELLLSVYDKQPPASEARVKTLAALLEQLPALKFSDNKCQAVLKHAATWSKTDVFEHGDPTLHDSDCAQVCRGGRLFASERSLFARLRHRAAHVALVRAWAAEGAASERDLYYARAALQALCFDQLFAASELHAAAAADAERSPARRSPTPSALSCRAASVTPVRCSPRCAHATPPRLRATPPSRSTSTRWASTFSTFSQQHRRPTCFQCFSRCSAAQVHDDDSY
jgi:hypothetical protein